MKRVMVPLGTLILLFVVSCGALPYSWKKSGKFNANKNVTVQIRYPGANAAGTGVIVGKGGYVLTNKHVVSKEGQKYEVCVIIRKNVSCAPAVVVRKDENYDLALLRTSFRFNAQVSFGNEDKLEPYEPVYSWSSVHVILPPSPFEGRYVGKIEKWFTPLIQYPVISFDLTGNPGGSGSPIFNLRGDCVGILYAGTAFKGGTPISLAVPASEAVRFLKEAGL